MSLLQNEMISFHHQFVDEVTAQENRARECINESVCVGALARFIMSMRAESGSLAGGIREGVTAYLSYQ